MSSSYYNYKQYDLLAEVAKWIRANASNLGGYSSLDEHYKSGYRLTVSWTGTQARKYTSDLNATITSQSPSHNYDKAIYWKGTKCHKDNNPRLGPRPEWTYSLTGNIINNNNSDTDNYSEKEIYKHLVWYCEKKGASGAKDEIMIEPLDTNKSITLTRKILNFFIDNFYKETSILTTNCAFVYNPTYNYTYTSYLNDRYGDELISKFPTDTLYEFILKLKNNLIESHITSAIGAIQIKKAIYTITCNRESSSEPFTINFCLTNGSGMGRTVMNMNNGAIVKPDIQYTYNRGDYINLSTDPGDSITASYRVQWKTNYTDSGSIETIDGDSFFQYVDIKKDCNVTCLTTDNNVFTNIEVKYILTSSSDDPVEIEGQLELSSKTSTWYVYSDDNSISLGGTYGIYSSSSGHTFNCWYTNIRNSPEETGEIFYSGTRNSKTFPIKTVKAYMSPVKISAIFT